MDFLVRLSPCPPSSSEESEEAAPCRRYAQGSGIEYLPHLALLGDKAPCYYRDRGRRPYPLHDLREDETGQDLHRIGGRFLDHA